MKIIPRKKYILIKPEDPETKSASGLYIPENEEKEQKARGTVVSVGSEVKDIKTGDSVIFGMFAGDKVKIKESKAEVDYLLLHDDDVLAFIK